MIEANLIRFLLERPDMQAVVGTRIHDLVLPQEPTLPAIVWQKISGTHEHSHDGPSHLAHPRIQFACWAKTLLEAIQVADALQRALDGFSGSMQGQDAYAIFILNEQDFFDPETGLRRRIVDYELWHYE